MAGRVVLLIWFLIVHMIVDGFAQDTLMIISDLETLKTKPSHIRTKNYLGAKWQIGTVYLFNGQSISDKQIRYDLDNNRIEIRAHDAVKILEGFKVRRFEWAGKMLKKRYL